LFYTERGVPGNKGPNGATGITGPKGHNGASSGSSGGYGGQGGYGGRGADGTVGDSGQKPRSVATPWPSALLDPRLTNTYFCGTTRPIEILVLEVSAIDAETRKRTVNFAINGRHQETTIQAGQAILIQSIGGVGGNGGEGGKGGQGGPGGDGAEGHRGSSGTTAHPNGGPGGRGGDGGRGGPVRCCYNFDIDISLIWCLDAAMKFGLAIWRPLVGLLG